MGLITGSKVGITIAAMCAALMAILDISIVNVALNDIRASFGTPLDQIAWVSTGYMMANVIVIPMTGWLQRRFGFRRYFTASILIFIAASALCGIAWSLPSLVFFRMLQGCGGGAIIPTSQSILFARYPHKEHGMAGALFGIGAMTGPLLGPTIGGYLIDIANWHWIFLINVPFGFIAAALAWRYIEEPSFKPLNTPIDARGISLLAVGMASLQYVLEEGNREGWSDSKTIMALSAIAAVALVTFIVHEFETPNPVVDLSVFKNASYAASTGINFLIGTALFAGSFMLSLYLGTVMHYKALDIGMLFLKGSAIQLLVMPLVGRLIGKVDGRAMVALGLGLLTMSLWLNGQLTSMSSERMLIEPIFIRALGLCFVFVPLSVIALSDLPAAKLGSATGLFNLTRELGGSIGTAFMSTMLSHRTFENYSHLSDHVSDLSPITREQLTRSTTAIASILPDPAAGGLQILQGRISLQALILAFNANYVQLAMVFALSLVLIIVLKRPTATGPIEGVH